MKRLALIEYDCGETACEECEHLDTIGLECDLFGHPAWGWPYRRSEECIAATQRAAGAIFDPPDVTSGTKPRPAPPERDSSGGVELPLDNPQRQVRVAVADSPDEWEDV
jgi:hypothetical protein